MVLAVLFCIEFKTKEKEEKINNKRVFDFGAAHDISTGSRAAHIFIESCVLCTVPARMNPIR